MIEGEKKFIVRKYIMAKSAEEALKKEKKFNADDVWVDEKWQEKNENSYSSEIKGFELRK